MDPSPEYRRVPPTVVRWLLLVTATFVAGCLTISLLPSDQVTVVNMGVLVNVVMAIGVGAVLVWSGRPDRLFCAAGLGAVVTVFGWDLLTFTQAEIQGVDGLGVVPLDVIALPVAALGMMLLLGAGAALGGAGRVLTTRCRSCSRRWQLGLDSPPP